MKADVCYLHPAFLFYFVYPQGFLQLMQELGEVANEGNLQALEIKVSLFILFAF